MQETAQNQPPPEEQEGVDPEPAPEPAVNGEAAEESPKRRVLKKKAVEVETRGRRVS